MLRNYQQKMLNHTLTHDRCALMVGMGMGKSLTCLELIDLLNIIEPTKTLILAPKRVAQSTWTGEQEKWQMPNIKIASLVGTPAQRKKALESDANTHVINYENIEWLLSNIDKFDYDLIIADESTKLKGFRTRQGTKRSKALAKVAFRAKRFILLTGTPSPNGLKDLWGQIWFLDKGERLGRTFSQFQDTYFMAIPLGNTGINKYEPLPESQEIIQNKIKDICLSLEAKDYFELGDTIINNVYIDLPAGVRKQYEQLEKDMYLELIGNDIDAVNAAALTTKCLQIANGALYVNEGKDFVELHDEKLDALESIVNESGGMPILVAYHFKHDLARLQKRFPEARPLDANPQTIDDWNAGKISMLLAHPASAGHGLNLQHGGNILVFFSNWWNLEEYQQIVERIGATRQAQSGYDRPVFIYHIVARDTVDAVVIGRRDSKKSVQEILMEAMKNGK